MDARDTRLGAIPMVTVRDYQPGDLDECVALYIRVFGEPPWEEVWDPADARAHLEQILLTPGSLGLVALEDDQIMGMLLGVEKHTSTGGAFIVDDVFVEGAKQRHRVGSELMNALKERLRARGVTTARPLHELDRACLGVLSQAGLRRDSPIALPALRSG